MKKVAVMVFSMMLFFSVASPTNAASFRDIPTNHWAKSEIDYIANQGGISGYPNGKFAPNEKVTRAQAAAILVRALQYDTSFNSKRTFSDVPSNHWAYKDIVAAVDSGLFLETKKFEPNRALTREEMSLALSHAFRLESSDTDLFDDVDLDHQYLVEVSILRANYITQGYPNNLYKPKEAVTRVQFAVFLARCFDNWFIYKDLSKKTTDQSTESDLVMTARILNERRVSDLLSYNGLARKDYAAFQKKYHFSNGKGLEKNSKVYPAIGSFSYTPVKSSLDTSVDNPIEIIDKNTFSVYLVTTIQGRDDSWKLHEKTLRQKHTLIKKGNTYLYKELTSTTK